MRIKAILLLVTLSICLPGEAKSPHDAREAKRDFRGAWLHTVYQSQYKRQTTEQNKKYLLRQLDSLSNIGINAVIFQVRPSADAFYKSGHEPWSRFLTDGGKEPDPFWDPLEFVAKEAHARGMELHAWLNPYRVTTSKNEKLPAGHIALKHPERFLDYEGKKYFDPGMPENREFIIKVVDDIVSRYDIDAIHFDDYFYPYPGKTAFPDTKSYRKYGNDMELGDWRRSNVDSLVKEVNEAIKARKPWVRFGISPFGIWRNKKTDPRGSDTDGLENYDDLYADVMLWARQRWIDYLAPQLYWTLENPRASYTKLIKWWSDNKPGGLLFVGQDVSRTMTTPDTLYFNQPNQLSAKMQLVAENTSVDGNIWWPGYTLTSNKGGVADSLYRNHYRYLALPPAYPALSSEKPAAPKNLILVDGVIYWDASKKSGEEPMASDPVMYAVYRFERGAEAPFRLDDPAKIISISSIPAFSPSRPGVYIITAIDRVNNESAPSLPITIF